MTHNGKPPVGQMGNGPSAEYIASTLNALASAQSQLAAVTRERDEARAILNSAERGSPIYKAIERVLDEHSAWIARPNHVATKAIALAAGVAWSLASKDALGAELIDAQTSVAAANERVKALEALLHEARHKGLIYWEPQTGRGYKARNDMLSRIDAALAAQQPESADG